MGRAMRAHQRYCCLLTGLLVSGFACAQQWFAVIGPDAESASLVVEVDLDSVHARGHVGEAIIVRASTGLSSIAVRLSSVHSWPLPTSIASGAASA